MTQLPPHIQQEIEKITIYTAEYLKLNWQGITNGALKDILRAQLTLAFQAGQDSERERWNSIRCERCGSPFEPHHHRHITRTGSFHTGCYEKSEQEPKL